MKSKDSTKSQFTLEETQIAVLCSKLAYYEENAPEHKQLLEEIRNHGGPKNLKKVTPFYKSKQNEPDQLAGCVMVIDDSLIVAFHGTASLEEVKSDLKFFHKNINLDNGQELTLHGGFAEEFELSNESRKRAMFEAQTEHDFKVILYTGHSLGGAIASYAALYDRINSSFSVLARIITFGAPKIFSHQTAKIYQDYELAENTLHLQQKYDLVTMVPAESMDFTHVGYVAKIPTDIRSGVHLLNTAYNDIVIGSYKENTRKVLSKLKNIPEINDYKPFDINSYNNSVMSLDAMSFATIIRLGRKMPKVAAIGIVGVAAINAIAVGNLLKKNISNPVSGFVPNKLRNTSRNKNSKII